MAEAAPRRGTVLSGLLTALVLTGCAKPDAPSVNVWLAPGVHNVMGVSVEVSPDRTILRDPGCGVFVLKKGRELATPGLGYEYTITSVTDLAPECAIAGEARLLQAGSSVEDAFDRQRYPLGGRMSYLLLAGSCMPGQGCETLLGRYFSQNEPPQTNHYRDIARRNGG